MANLKIYYQNVRGLRTKTTDFKSSVGLSDYDVICLTETWLHDQIFDDELFDDRYCVWRRDRDYALTGQVRGGGVAIAVRRDILADAQPQWQSSAEDLWVTIRLRRNPNKNLHICVLYLCEKVFGNSFSSQLSNFLDTLENFMSNRSDDTFLVLGDFNMSAIEWIPYNEELQAFCTQGSHVISFIDTINMCNLRQFNSIGNLYNRILDLVLCNAKIVTVSRCLDSLIPKTPIIHLYSLLYRPTYRNICLQIDV